MATLGMFSSVKAVANYVFLNDLSLLPLLLTHTCESIAVLVADVVVWNNEG